MTEETKTSREFLGSRLGFILLSAGCAIGLGNIWRFPYITGQYGGALFVCFYLIFLFLLGFPAMVMELSIGRGSRQCLVGCFRTLKPADSRIPWVGLGKLFFAGNLVLLMFYSVITGWLLSYTYDYLVGIFNHLQPDDIGTVFGLFLGNYMRQILFTFIALGITTAICISGLKSGVERCTKFMMAGLLILIIALAIYAMTLKGGMKGVVFFLKPDLKSLTEHGVLDALHAAMAQAFFTLSLGVGSIAIFGSYADKSKALAQEATIIIGLDTFVALCAGLIIFPCCFAFGVEANAGPGLIFVTLPRIFLSMPNGGFFGFVFFLFMSIAALTTLVAVTENLIAFGIDELHLKRRSSTVITTILLFILSLPCVFGFNLWSGFQPLGKGTNVLDLEDFIVSDNLLPLGALCVALFCTHKWGWGLEKFYEEANTGNGLKMPKAIAWYLTYVLPVIILAIYIIGICKRFL